MDFPIIDVSDIDNSQLSIAGKITDACKTWGFILLKNHNIPVEDIDEMFQLAREFFLNMGEDKKAPWSINSKYVGYSSALSDAFKDDKASMWLSGKPGSLKDDLDSLPPFWRQHTDKIEAFKHGCHSLVIKLLICFALAMELPDRNHFAKAHAEDAGNGNKFRLICYPSRDNDPVKNTTRMSQHSDSGSVTLLFQTCSGLEVESPTGQWIQAPHIPGHILVNLGDALAFWSGARLKATPHRVTFGGVPHDAERLTMAYFGAAAPETLLEPIHAVGETEKLQNYDANGVVIQPGITVGEYGRLVMEKIYGSSVAQKPAVAVANAA
ncbi:Clavaminate synthase-like protein [Polychaeton citri CBS 116435]|uniref:Clavaminate synthase-like protein n=1 Tax=Polychaeton citri CBS 116435 TaxID=1314669 RepID=A0A9P4Q6N1_9PEZI|nr:Clavaminate synthase-like protein [Polychaeton citri CBS 116435]